MLDLAIAFEINLIDERIFFNNNSKLAAILANLHIREQPRLEQRLHRGVDLVGCNRFAGLDLHIRAHRIGLNALIALHNDGRKPRCLRHATCQPYR